VTPAGVGSSLLCDTGGVASTLNRPANICNPCGMKYQFAF
jgi:hypothetical protein